MPEARPRAITAEAFAKALVAAGILSDLDTIFRVVIDAKAGNLVLIYLERVGDERLLDVIPTLDGIEVQHA